MDPITAPTIHPVEQDGGGDDDGTGSEMLRAFRCT